MAYLETIAKKIAKIDRGKLRGAVCTSLYRIFGSIMGEEDGQAQVYWGAFTSRFQMLANQYQQAYASIYHTVAKWAKKAKHALPCWRLMVRMTCVGSSSFYLDRKRDQVRAPRSQSPCRPLLAAPRLLLLLSPVRPT